MTYPLAIALAGASLALASFFKYGFGYLQERYLSRQIREGIQDFLAVNQPMIVEETARIIIFNLQQNGGEIIVEEFRSDSVKETGK